MTLREALTGLGVASVRAGRASGNRPDEGRHRRPPAAGREYLAFHPAGGLQ
jgi:hypothetical protein